jgi:hypothetical protein
VREQWSECLCDDRALRDAFSDALSRAKEAYIAVAWARPGWPLEAVAKYQGDLHCVVGVSFGMTHPDALAALQRQGNLWVMKDSTDRIFHPKLYIFKMPRGVEIFVGSANLTKGGFFANSEAVVRLRTSAAEAGPWYKIWDQWCAAASKVNGPWIDAYRRRYKGPKGGFAKLAQSEDLERISKRFEPTDLDIPELLNAEWPKYERYIRQAASQRWEDDALEDPRGSYLETLRLAGPIARRPLPQPGTLEFRRLMGTTKAKGQITCAYFGNMSAGGQGVHEMGHNSPLRKQINSIMPRVVKARNQPELLESAERLYTAVTSTKGVKCGVATRLLTLARPDRFFSVNTASTAMLSEVLEVPAGSLKHWDGYSAQLRQLWASPWCTSSRPKARLSGLIWDARVALLDVACYRPKPR